MWAISGRNWVFRLSIILVVCGLSYGSSKHQDFNVNCTEKSLEPRIGRRSNYSVLYNYVPMEAAVKCSETLTFTTQADFRFLDNLEPLLARWRAPISVAVYAPGSDFQPTLESIKYSRSCGNRMIKKFVTFHVYYDIDHAPSEIPTSEEVSNAVFSDCSLSPPWKNSNYARETYRMKHQLLYPINVGRNIALESAPTHYVLASDIELYPTPNLPSKFLTMLKQSRSHYLTSNRPKVYVLPVFEVSKDSSPPSSKTELVNMVTKTQTAVAFHKFVCANCHEIPQYNRWLQTPEDNGLHVLYNSRRHGRHWPWEPVFIGTHEEPIWDERLSWDGQSDKRIQAYILCVLNYDFLILDNAFLVHRPGIKHYKRDDSKVKIIAETNARIRNVILPEYNKRYGKDERCAV